MMGINNRNHYLRVICLYLQPSPVPLFRSSESRDELHHHQAPASYLGHLSYSLWSQCDRWDSEIQERDGENNCVPLLNWVESCLLVSECKPVCQSGKISVSQENNPIKCQNFGHLVILRKTQTLDWQSLFVEECWLSCCPRLNLAS